jgi:hypothetical protein
MPTRVIDLGPQDSSTPKLVLSSPDDEPGKWVSLSHTWGRPDNPFVTNSLNLSERLQGLSLEDMPATFRDAIIVIRKLGYRFLWIDSLCILQDSESDWNTEGAKMADYYGKAALTIVASFAKDDAEGFLESRKQN